MYVTAIQRFRLGERWLEEGDSAEVGERYGRVMLLKGRVKVGTPPPSNPPYCPSQPPLPSSSWNFSPTTPNGFPDLRPFFKHTQWRPMPYSKGTLIGSDFTDKRHNDPVFGVYKHCGFWSVNETKLLFQVAKSIGGYWLDIGGLTGWTSAHLSSAGCHVASLDPMYSNPEFRSRAAENLSSSNLLRHIGLWPLASDELFSRSSRSFSGIVIDGGHDHPHPLHDAINASTRVLPNGVIFLHDANKDEVREGVNYLSNAGWRIQTYPSSHGVALCYHDGFTPPQSNP